MYIIYKEKQSRRYIRTKRKGHIKPGRRKITLTKAVELTPLAGLPFPTPPPSSTTFLQTH